MFAYSKIKYYGQGSYRLHSLTSTKINKNSISNPSQKLENGLQSHFPRNSLEKLEIWNFYWILSRQEKAARSSNGHDFLFLNAQTHVLEGPPITFSIWYRANMDLKKIFDNHAQPLSDPSEGLVKGTIQYTGFPREIQQKIKICEKIVLMLKKYQNKLGNGFFTLKLT